MADDIKNNVTVAEAEFLAQTGYITDEEYEKFMKVKANMVRNIIREHSLTDEDEQIDFSDCALDAPQNTNIRMK